MQDVRRCSPRSGWIATNGSARSPTTELHRKRLRSHIEAIANSGRQEEDEEFPAGGTIVGNARWRIATTRMAPQRNTHVSRCHGSIVLALSVSSRAAAGGGGGGRGAAAGAGGARAAEGGP